MSIDPVNSTSPAYGKNVDAESPKKPEPPPQLDTIDPAAAATKGTPPSCLARYCTYVKHRIADFFDWVCSLFCSSKPVTKEQLDAAGEEIKALLDEVNADVGELLKKRYIGVKLSSTNDAYPYLAEYIECLELDLKINNIITRLETQWQKGVLTERQLRVDRRQLIELSTSARVFAHSDLPKKTTPAMMDKVKAYSLGKLTITDQGKVVSWVDTKGHIPDDFVGKAGELIQEIRNSSFEKFGSKIRELGLTVEKRYKEVTPKDLETERQAVHVLADCIAVKEIVDSLLSKKGDISEESLTKRIESLEKRLAQPVCGEATKEMYEKVKEFNWDVRGTVKILYTIVPGRGAYISDPSGDSLRNRLREAAEIVSKVQGPQEQK